MFSFSGQLCATTLERHEEDFSPFCEYTEDIPSFAMYVDRIRNSADWGGHVELRALSLALKRPILVYSQSQSHPLEIHCETNREAETEPIRLSYHLHYYSLGEHYNCVMPKSNNKNNDHDDDDDNNKNDHDETV
jgi:OTU domain-containing protein 6